MIVLSAHSFGAVPRKFLFFLSVFRNLPLLSPPVKRPKIIISSHDSTSNQAQEANLKWHPYYPSAPGPGKLLKLFYKNPNNFIRSAIQTARSCQVKALTPTHPQYKLPRCVSATPPSLSLSIVHGPATQLAPPPANHAFHRHINGPHYVPWPYGTPLGGCERVCLRRGVCSAVLETDCAGDEAKLLLTSLRIAPLWLRCQRKYGRRAEGRGGGDHNGLFASASECHPRCPPSVRQEREDGQSRVITL